MMNTISPIHKYLNPVIFVLAPRQNGRKESEREEIEWPRQKDRAPTQKRTELYVY